MHIIHFETPADKPRFYGELAVALDALLADELDPIANLSNAAALLYQYLPDINWAGFYLLKSGELVLGPFQGKPACTRIALDRGVCGAAATQRRTIVVTNVHEFPGHIVCDTASNAEIVVPLIDAGCLIGVLDVDSPTVARFDEQDRAGLEKIAARVVASITTGSAANKGAPA